MRDVLQFHSAFGEEVSLEEILDEVAAGFSALSEEGYVFDIKPQSDFETNLVEGCVGLAKYQSDYGSGRVTFAATMNKFQEPPWVKELLGVGPPGRGAFVFTGETSGCKEDVEEIGISFESIFGQYGLRYTKADVDEAIDASRNTKIPIVRGAFLGYALGLECSKGLMGDEERIEWLIEQDKRAWEAVRTQGTMSYLREIAACFKNEYASLLAEINAWRKQK